MFIYTLRSAQDKHFFVNFFPIINTKCKFPQPSTLWPTWKSSPETHGWPDPPRTVTNWRGRYPTWLSITLSSPRLATQAKSARRPWGGCKTSTSSTGPGGTSVTTSRWAGTGRSTKGGGGRRWGRTLQVTTISVSGSASLEIGGVSDCGGGVMKFYYLLPLVCTTQTCWFFSSDSTSSAATGNCAAADRHGS